MDYGIFLAPAADSWKVVKRAEELGYRRAWFYDTQMLNAELIRATTFTATAAELRERVRDLDRAGCAHLGITIRHGHPEMLEERAELIETV